MTHVHARSSCINTHHVRACGECPGCTHTRSYSSLLYFASHPPPAPFSPPTSITTNTTRTSTRHHRERCDGGAHDDFAPPHKVLALIPRANPLDLFHRGLKLRGQIFGRRQRGEGREGRELPVRRALRRHRQGGSWCLRQIVVRSEESCVGKLKWVLGA